MSRNPRIPSVTRHKALAIYRAWRRHLGHRQAYWLVVVRYGHADLADLAWSFLKPLTKNLAAVCPSGEAASASAV